MADKTCPPFGTGSVDFNAFHKADKQGADLVAALAKATTTVADEPAPEPPIVAEPSAQA